MMMTESLTFGLGLDDGSDRLHPRAWKEALVCALARTGEGLAVCDADLRVLYTTPRAIHLLARLGMGPERELPASVANLVSLHLAANDVSRVDRLPAVSGGAPVCVHVDAVRGAPPAKVAIWLKPDQLRDDELYAAMRERYSITPRGFQLAQLVRRGLSNRQIGAELRLTESTVKVYLHQLYRDCGVPSRTALIALLDRIRR